MNQICKSIVGDKIEKKARKKILITGVGSYIGESVKKWLLNNPEQYKVDTLDMLNYEWDEKSFVGYDVIFHVAGIVHKKETHENKQLYYEVNRDLVFKVASKAKREGIRQFIFLSSMSVYGINMGVITKDTVPHPKTNYGKSKYQAEQMLNQMKNNNFLVTILRPPMVYGKNCKGNFQTVVKLVKNSPIFPQVNNRRSMIYIDNLCSFVKLCIDEELSGIFCPQNNEYVQTSQMAVEIAKSLDKKLYLSKEIGVGIKIMIPWFAYLQKAFGTLIYYDTEEFNYSYCVSTNEESFRKSVKDNIE